MAKNSRAKNLAQVKKSLGILKSKGLYKPVKPRAKPTRYGLQLLKKYSDVAAGRSFVVKADKSALAKLAENFKVTRGRVVIPKVGTNVAPIVTKSGDVIRRASFGSTRYRYRPMKLVDGNLPPLGPHQSYTVQIMEGRKPVQLSFASQEELLRAVTEYDSKGGRGFDLMKYVQIAEPEGKFRYRIHFTKAGARSKTRIVRVAFGDMAIDEFRYRFPEFTDWIVTKVEPLDG